MLKKRQFFLVVFCLVLVVSYAKQIYAKQKYSAKFNIVNIRRGPALSQKIIWRVEKFCPFIVINKKGSWYQVEDFEGDKGWVHSSCLTQKTKTAITIKEDRILRKKPSMTSKIAFKTKSKGVPFKVLKEQGEWRFVLHSSGHKGWIHKKDVW